MSRDIGVYTLQMLADHVNGQVVGDPDIEVTGIQPFELAVPGDLTLAAEKKYLQDLSKTAASAVIVPFSLSAETPAGQKSLLQTRQPKAAFARLLALVHYKPFSAGGISPMSFIGQNCQISEDVTISAFVHIGDNVTVSERVILHPGVCVGNGCSIGPDSVLYPNVTLYDGVVLGSQVILHAGAVIGADGFGYVFDGQDQVKIPQVGSVIIGDDVEIGANSCVDRATFGATTLESGVKLDNQVHIGHNCRIGQNTVIVAQVGLSGSVEVGKNCVFAGHAGVVDHVKIGDRVTVLMKSAVSKDVPSGSVVSGQPAIEHRRAMKIEALVRRLPEIYREWKAVRRKVAGDG
ncbi:MAG: UDP-3-O-(3-hydroxymyristoyl)glucosamine N-acyltransferase [Acidobacteriota bacterium]